jgi:hypothetical protein
MRYYKILNGKRHFKACVLLFVVITTYDLRAQFLITSPTYTYTQDFGTSVISASGTNITSGTANLTGWSYDAALTSELNITAAAPTNAGGRYAYTLNGNSNRKIGSRPSGSTNDIEYGILFRNTSGQTIQSFSASYTGYQISQGGNTNANINKLTVDYIVSTSSIAITAPAGTAIPALDFSQTQFVTTANTGGQGQGYPAAVGTGANSGCVSVGASIPNNSYLLLRWIDPDDSQNDPHFAIDNVEVVFFTNQTVANNAACSFLPIDLLDFYVVNNGASNNINWKVAQEENITQYALEKSENGIDFTELGVVNLSVSSDATKTYHFPDPNPGAEITYYRLSTLEKDRSRRFYKIISLENKPDPWTYTAYQNGNKLNVEFKGTVPTEGTISLLNMSGVVLMEQSIMTYHEALDLKQLANGIYVVRITSPGKTEHFKIVITN